MFNLPNLRFTWGGLHGDVSCNLSTLARVGGGRLNECKSNEGICGREKWTDGRVSRRRSLSTKSHAFFFPSAEFCKPNTLESSKVHFKLGIQREYSMVSRQLLCVLRYGKFKNQFILCKIFWEKYRVIFTRCKQGFCSRLLLTTRNEVIA